MTAAAEKHTPGPWKAISSGSWEPWSGAIEIHAAGETLAWTTFGGAEKANARLIAAAPDTFAICKMLEDRLPLIADPDAVGEDDCAEVVITWREWSDIRAAIAKASSPA